MTAKLDIIADATADDMTTNPPVTTEESAAVTTSDRGSWGKMPEVAADDIYVPRLKLGQATTAEVVAGDARPGQWVIQGYQGMATPTVVPIAYRKVHRRLGTQPGKPVACYDHTGPADVDCPNCRWQHDPALNKGDFTAVLSSVHNFTVFVEEINGPAAVEFTGTSETAGKMLVGKAVSRGLCNFAVKLGSSPAKNGKGSWHVAAIQELTEVPTKLLERVKEFVNS